MKLRQEQINSVRELLGYLNFSGGRHDPQFAKAVDRLAHEVPSWTKQHEFLEAALNQLHDENAAGFEVIDQARAILDLTFNHLIPAYRVHHTDLLAHLSAEDFQWSFLLVRFFEAVLEAGAPWDDVDRIVRVSLQKLNDFLGYRPIAILENGRKMTPYGHERLRPFPLYLKGVGAGQSPYTKLIEKTIELLEQAPQEILTDAWFDLQKLDELSLDPRAHDHMHPANKRTNYLFGEWDPHQIDLSGNYRRFVVRKVILDALLHWMSEQKKMPVDEVIYDAAAVLCGTILMASAISGAGPESHDSTVSLTSLLPRVARQRDRFYAMLLESATGARAKRLQKQAKATQQPFGHVRQYLNMYLAEYGAQQVQRRHLAYMYARMGFADEARKQANTIPAAAARFECEIQWRFTAFRREIERNNLDAACDYIEEITDHLHRGIECGAIVDPWNVLGFQGHFPLFSSREDSVPDQRIEQLLHLVELILEAYAIALQEAAVRGRTDRYDELKSRFSEFGDWWDRFGTTTVSDLPLVAGKDSYDSALHVAETLAQWRSAGEAAGDMSFWRQHVDRFESAKAYAQVVESLLDRKDTVASLGLLMQWLSQAANVGLESGPHSLFGLLVDWLELALDSETRESPPQWKQILRLFDYLEANAGELWTLPTVSAVLQGVEQMEAEAAEEEEPSGEQTIYGAAYEGITYRDTTNDGVEGEIADGQGTAEPGEFELLDTLFEPYIKFARMRIQLWQVGASECAMAIAAERKQAAEKAGETEGEPTPKVDLHFTIDHVEDWLSQCESLQKDLERLVREVQNHGVSPSSGDHDANVEFDVQMQTKFYLMQSIILIQVSCRVANWCLAALLDEMKNIPIAIPAPVKASENEEGKEPEEPAIRLATDSTGDTLIVDAFRCVFRREAVELRKLLPSLLADLKTRPLLYIPLEHDGEAQQVVAARTAQAVIRFLLCHLPRLGLLRETWHLLRTAHEMERSSRPVGMAVTEFDRLFRIAMRNSLESVVQASRTWKRGKFQDEDLIEIVGSIVEYFLDQWLEHSSTMRLSTVETLKLDPIWEETRDFTKKYGNELLNARVLTLGNLRTILHQGVEKYLSYLEETEDPLQPVPLLEDLRTGVIKQRDAVETLRLVYQIIVDRFDRFLEYNTTTTQSDYGQLFFSLLDFLRLETSYERDAWNLLPVAIAHEVLARQGREEAADIWEEVFSVKTEDMANRHLAELHKLERQYGMRLPSVTSHLQERFVKPLAVNNMLALVPRAVADARADEPTSRAFQSLQQEIELYLKDCSGSGLEIPNWLRALEEELNEGIVSGAWTRGDAEPELNVPAVPFSLREVRQQIKIWKSPLGSKPKKSDG